MARGGIVRLALFAAVLAVVAALAALAGRVSGVGAADTAPDAMGHGSSAAGRTASFGISDVAGGYRLELAPTTLGAGSPTRVVVRIADADGAPVTGLDEAHDEPPLHLILVRRDLAGYRHLHPARSGDGFETTVTLPDAGVWRAYADFEVDGERVVLGRDLLVPGRFAPRRLPPPAPVSSADGYSISLSHEGLRAGRESRLTFAVSRAGERVELQPYLGADGHLVAIREEDLAYHHVHPLAGAEAGVVAFDAELGEAGAYALFLQFKDGGTVHTGRFTVEVER